VRTASHATTSNNWPRWYPTRNREALLFITTGCRVSDWSRSSSFRAQMDYGLCQNTWPINHGFLTFPTSTRAVRISSMTQHRLGCTTVMQGARSALPFWMKMPLSAHIKNVFSPSASERFGLGDNRAHIYNILTELSCRGGFEWESRCWYKFEHTLPTMLVVLATWGRTSDLRSGWYEP
jgi:hypothetical protein